MGKELERLGEGPKTKIHLDSLWATLKKYQTEKHQNVMAYMDTGFKKFTSIHDIGMIMCLQETDVLL